MKKQMKIVPCALCLVLSAVAALWTGTAAAKDADYWDPSERMPKDADVDTVNATTRSISNGWYVVEGKITIDGTLALEGDANLILADDAELTVTGGIAGELHNLTVWGRTRHPNRHPRVLEAGELRLKG